MKWLALAFHILAAAVGIYVFVLTFVMRETTEGRWVNRIEEFWIRVDDRRRAAGGRWLSLFKATAAKLIRVFNRVVGERMLSLRLVGISGTLSFTSLSLFYALMFGLLSYLFIAYHDLIKQKIPGTTNLELMTAVVIIGCVLSAVFAIMFGALACLPVIFKSRFWVWLSCLPTTLAFLFFLRVAYLRALTKGALAIFLSLIISLASDVLWVAVVRQSLGWITAKVSLARVAWSVAVQIFLVLLIFLLPMQVLLHQARHRPATNFAIGAFTVSVFNFPTVIASTCFIGSLAFLILHHVTWPVIERVFYILTRPEVLEKRKYVRLISAAIAVYGLHGIPSVGVVSGIIEHLKE